jgi:hypothetical protein
VDGRCGSLSFQPASDFRHFRDQGFIVGFSRGGVLQEVPYDAVVVEVSVSADDAAGTEGFVRERVPDEIKAQVRRRFVPGGTRDGFGWGGRVIGGVRGKEFFQPL